jgi:citrate synthase
MSEPEFRPGLADVPVAESAISFIDGKRARLEYRGIAVEALARESTFEETSWLLLKGALPTQRELALFDRDLKQNRSLKYRQIDILKCLPPSGHPMEALQASLAALGMFFPAKEVSFRVWENLGLKIFHFIEKLLKKPLMLVLWISRN